MSFTTGTLINKCSIIYLAIGLQPLIIDINLSRLYRVSNAPNLCSKCWQVPYIPFGDT